MKAMLTLLLPTLLFIGCAPAPEETSPASQEAQAEMEKEFSMMDIYHEINSVLLLTPEESTALEQGFKDREARITAWLEGPKGQKLIELEAKIKEYAQAKDRSAMQAVIAQSKPLREEIIKLIKNSEKELLESLGSERKIEWEAHEVSREMLELMTPLGLDDTQRADIQYAAVDFLYNNQRESNPQAAAYLELERWAEDNVLDNAQYDTYQALKQSKPMRSLVF